jgi:MIF4G domain
MRSILNKLTPQKFDLLVEQVKKMDINSEEKLTGVIELVFEKVKIPLFYFLVFIFNDDTLNLCQTRVSDKH